MTAAAASVSLAALRATRNSVIGNAVAKQSIADDGSVPLLVHVLFEDSSTIDENEIHDLRTEAANILYALAHNASLQVLRSLIDNRAHDSLLFALCSPRSTRLTIALTRALAALYESIANSVRTLWGLQPSDKELRSQAAQLLDSFFAVQALDIYLPYFVEEGAVGNNIAVLLAASIRTEAHRTAVLEWAPPYLRGKEHKGKRGWETLEIASAGWLVKHLKVMLSQPIPKKQKVALYTLAALVKDNQPLANILTRSPIDRGASSTLEVILTLLRSNHIDLQLAACHCATNIHRASGPPVGAVSKDPSVPLAALQVLLDIFELNSLPLDTRARAGWILSHLALESRSVQRLAADSRALEKLANGLTEIAPDLTGLDDDWEDDEASGIANFREAALMAIASHINEDEEARRAAIPMITSALKTALTSKRVGVRFAACLCVRPLTRSVHALRTTLHDAGLGNALLQLFVNPEEDHRILLAATTCITNMVLTFSPFKKEVMARGALNKLVKLMESEDRELRINVLWALKNMVCEAPLEEILEVSATIGWERLAIQLAHQDFAIQEQAFAFMCNVCAEPRMLKTAFERINPSLFAILLSRVLSEPLSDDVLRYALQLFANLLNGADPSQRATLLAPAEMLNRLREVLTHPSPLVRRPAVGCIKVLAEKGERAALMAAHINRTLRGMLGSEIELRHRDMTLPVLEPDIETQESIRIALGHLS